MVVYIDVLLVLNLFVNYFLLLATAKINNIPCRFWRLFAGAMVGAAFSLTILLPELSVFADIAIKFLMSFIIVVATFSFKSLKRFLRLVASFFGVTFVYAGSMLALWFMFQPGGMAINNSVVYFNISPLILIVSTVVCFGVITLIRMFTKAKTPSDTIYNLEIGYKDKIVRCKALLDTGNSLTDLFTNAPVIIAEYELVEYMLPIPAREVFAGVAADIPEEMAGRYRLIPYSAVGGKGLLPAFKPDYVTVNRSKKTSRVENVLVAVSKDKIADDYKALISNDLIKE